MKFKKWLEVNEENMASEGLMRGLLATGALASCGMFGCQPPKEGGAEQQQAQHVQQADNLKVTVERPRPNVWEFSFRGSVHPGKAIAQAKSMVMRETGAATEAGLAADFNKTSDGVFVKIMFTPPESRPDMSGRDSGGGERPTRFVLPD